MHFISYTLALACATGFIEPNTLSSLIWRGDSRHHKRAAGSSSEEVSSFQRLAPPPTGVATVLLPAERCPLPGSTQSLHFYDSNLLLALEHAENESSKTGESTKLALITFDPSKRKFSVGPGVIAEVVSITDNVKSNIKSELSESKIVVVRALHPATPKQITQYEPFVLTDLALDRFPEV
mmetsp:Transcript_31708/g.63282  ORF Transcript_31708/g.63282 Transcript_31708/m.63282 type:complete len:180 (+) Transcript_31708:69-608(+)